MRLAKFFFNSRSYIFLSFSAIQIMELVMPLLAYPWLGRKLGPEAFGLLMYMALIPAIVNLVMDWSFPLAASRQVARTKSYKKLRELVGAVLSAKLILCAGCFLAGAALLPAIPHARSWPCAYFLAIGAGTARGLNPLWYYQGIGRETKKLACCAVFSSLLVLALIFPLVSGPEDWWLYLALVFFIKGSVWLVLNLELWCRYKVMFSPLQAIRLLVKTRLIFLAFIWQSLCTNGSQLIMGYFLSVEAMGIIVAAGKMTRALASLAKPLAQTIFPQICKLAFKKKNLARKILFFSLAFLFISMVTATALVWINASLTIRIALGASFTNAVPVLRLMILAAPLMACNIALGEQFLVAWDFERERAHILAIGAVVSLLLAVFLPLFWNVEGAACLPLIVEGLVFLLFSLFIWSKRRYFWGR